MKLKLDIEEVRSDENVKYLVAQLATSVESQQLVNALVERIVQCANSHIWGYWMLSIQEEEESRESAS